MIKFVEKKHLQRQKISVDLLHLFEGELNPVAFKAQKRVPIPEGLDLDAYINEPEDNSDSEDSSDYSFNQSSLFPVIKKDELEKHGKLLNNGLSNKFTAHFELNLNAEEVFFKIFIIDKNDFFRIE